MRTLQAAMAAAVLIVAGCASGGNPPGFVNWDEQLDLGVPGPEIDRTASVSFYPACGNETLSFEGENWYPFEPSNVDDFPYVPIAVASEDDGSTPASASVDLVAFPAVVPPETGDDSGALTRFEGGFAHWASYSGRFQTWLTTTSLTYGWAC